MPYNNSSRTFQRVWKFLDEFGIREPATREAFDTALDDLKEGIDAALRERAQPSRADLEALVDAGFTTPDGVVLVAGGRSYMALDGATVLPSLPGWVPAGDVTPEHFDVAGTGSADDHDALQKALQYAVSNGIRAVARGTYGLADQVTIAFDGNLDWDFTGATFTVLSGFPGSSADVFKVEGSSGTDLTHDWIGGHYNCENQPAGILTSNDCINISVGSSASVVRFHPESIYAGEDWRTAGGDSLVFINADRTDVNIGHCQGAVDLGVYVTSSSTAGPARKEHHKIQGNFEKCRSAVSLKRQCGVFTIDIRATDCITGANPSAAEIDGDDANPGSDTGTVRVVAKRVQYPVSGGRDTKVTYDVTASDLGVYLPESSPGAGDEYVSTEGGPRFRGSKYCSGMLAVHGVNPDVAANGYGGGSLSNFRGIELEESVGSDGIVQTTDNMFILHCSGLGRIAFEQNSSDRNVIVYTGTATSPTISAGANSVFTEFRSWAALGAIAATTLSMDANNSGGDAQNKLVFRDQDGTAGVGQPMGRVEGQTFDDGAWNVSAYMEPRTEGANGNGEWVWGTGVKGSPEDRMRLEAAGHLHILRPGYGVKLVSPDGTQTGILTIDNNKNLVVT